MIQYFVFSGKTLSMCPNLLRLFLLLYIEVVFDYLTLLHIYILNFEFLDSLTVKNLSMFL